MHNILSAIDKTSRFTGRMAAQLYLFCTVITAYEVIMRYFFAAPSVWAYEIVMVLCATAWILSVGHVTYHRAHIAITILPSLLAPRARRRLNLFCDIAALVAMALLAYSAWHPAMKAFRFMERSASAFNSPEPMVMKSLLFLGPMMYAIQISANIVRDIRNWHEEETSHGH